MLLHGNEEMNANIHMRNGSIKNNKSFIHSSGTTKFALFNNQICILFTIWSFIILYLVPLNNAKNT